MSETTFTVSKSSTQELEHRIQKIIILADKLDILAFETRQASGFLKDAYNDMRPTERN